MIVVGTLGKRGIAKEISRARERGPRLATEIGRVGTGSHDQSRRRKKISPTGQGLLHGKGGGDLSAKRNTQL